MSGRLADLTIITSDNPRFEEPLAIMEDIKTGINRTTAYINRGITIAPSTLAEAFKLCALLHFMVLDNILLITGVIKFL